MRAERNEMLLLHRFYELNYVYPDTFKNLPGSYLRRHRQNRNMDEEGAEIGHKKKRENKYKGGKVFEPIKGLYNEYIVLLDFNSLYPSIIQEFNVCFTTCVRDPISLERQIAPFLRGSQKINKSNEPEDDAATHMEEEEVENNGKNAENKANNSNNEKDNNKQ